MKKIFMLFSLLAAMLLIMPLEVSAANFVYDSGTGSYQNDSAIGVGQYGTIEIGDASWYYISSEDGEKEWTFTFDTSSSYIYLSLVPSFVTIDSIDVSGSGFEKLNQTSNSDGSVDLLIEYVGSGTGTVTITVITIDTADDGCILNISPLNLDCGASTGGVYFDDSGNVITAEEYAEVCEGTTSSENLNDVPNSETGSVVPYVAISGGILAVVAVYLFSRKSNKVYKI